jgi:hypothetical protein
MTPEERAAQLAESWYNPEVFEDADAQRQELAFMAAIAIRAAVTEAMAIQSEVCAARLDVAAEFYRKCGGPINEIVAQALESEARGIRARSRGEGEG